MAEFAYQALDRGGATVSGVVQADNPDAGAERVRQMGLYPMALSAASERAAEKANGRPAARRHVGTTRVGRMDIVLFTRQLADLVGAGLPLDRTLTVLIRQTDSAGMRARLQTIQDEVRAGRSLSEALAAYPREFPPLFINMVRAGEVTGQLDTVLERLAGYLERELTRRGQIVSALTYPAVLVAVSISAVTFLLMFVIPRLATVFGQLGDAIPVPTAILLGFVGFLTAHWWQGAIGLAVGWIAWRQAVATTAGRELWDTWKLKLPLFGRLLRRIVSARFVRSLGTMLSGGVPILDSLEIAREAVGNVGASRAVDRVRERIRQGDPLADAMDSTGFFLPVAVHMAAVGEETGRLPAMLIRTADSLDFEIDSQIRRMVTLIEPLVVVLVGAFVGFIVLSILLPIFEANTRLH